MAAPDSTKLQVNFKLADGTLVNIYADSSQELESLLTTIQDTAPLIQGVSQSLGNSVRTSTVSSGGQASAPAQTSGEGERVADRYGNTWVYGIPSAPDCANGKMVLKEGVSEKTGKPYKGWYDPAAGPRWNGPKIAQEFRAKTIWV